MRRLVAVVFASLLLTAAASAQAAPTLVAIGTFDLPVFVTGAPRDGDRLFVIELTGRVRVVKGGVTLSQPFLDVTGGSFLRDSEGGLLSIAFAPDYETSGLVYSFSTETGPTIRIDEFRRSPGGDSVDPLSRRTVMSIPHPGHTNHFGGQLQFGPDGFLYISTGDGGGGGDPDENAEDLASPLGKILRIDPRGTSPYSIPPGNPFAAGPTPEAFHYGLRNPWRFSFDRMTGDVVIADVGQDAFEEVNFLPHGTGAGSFFGWDHFEGNASFEPAGTSPPHVPPVLTRPHASGDCSITGGYVVRDRELPTLYGRYLYADLCVGEIRSARLRAGAAEGDAATGLTLSSPTSFGEDAAGCLYVASLSGTVYRIVDSSRPTPALPCRPDVTPPETAIVTRPASVTRAREATFGLSATEPSGFECSLDGAVFVACSSSPSYAGLVDGSHSFSARAVDEAGNVDSSAAVAVWTVDTGAPETAIVTRPTALVGAATAAISFSSEDGAVFECRLDAAPFTPCSSPHVLSGLPEGRHELEVRAIDRAGNVDATPASAAWTVDVTPPTTQILSRPPPRTAARLAVVTFVSPEAARVECALDGGVFAPCVSPYARSGLSEGAHRLSVRGVDAAGNVEPATAAVEWTVDFDPRRRQAIESMLAELARQLGSKGFASLARGASLQVRGLVSGPGTVRVRLVRAGSVLAEGTAGARNRPIVLVLRPRPRSLRLLPAGQVRVVAEVSLTRASKPLLRSVRSLLVRRR